MTKLDSLLSTLIVMTTQLGLPRLTRMVQDYLLRTGRLRLAYAYRYARVPVVITRRR